MTLPAEALTVILLGEGASTVEKNAALDLQADIRRVCVDEEVKLETYNPTHRWENTGNRIFIGKSNSQPYFTSAGGRQAFSLPDETLEPETFVLQTGDPSRDGWVDCAIMGADDRGVTYGVYAFSEMVLGIDAMEYWTGKEPEQKTVLRFPAMKHRELPPRFKLRGYFDNDDDMLANYRGRKLVIEFETWKEMIDSLARLRYNYIDIHDTLGRPEYYLRDYYTQMTEYHTDLGLVDRIIDYAHGKGMLVQIPMYLGWEFRHLDMDEVCLSEHYEKWMEIYRYYLVETPLGKGDLFLARPRHPIYDWGYACPEEEAAGIRPGPLMEKLFSGLDQLIQQYRPGGQLICDLWQEGRELWARGAFAPDRGIQMLWADQGFAEFGEWPEDQKGYAFGIYIHAGVWKNQVVQDPYPGRIKEAVEAAVARGMTHNCLVNGQNFKPFILNLEACARALWNPEEFDGDAFYREWTSRYFGELAVSETVESLKLLHQAHDLVAGYRDVTRESVRILRKLSDKRPENLDPHETDQALQWARKSLELARQAEAKVPETASLLFDDQILFPATIFVQNLELLKVLITLNNGVYDHLHGNAHGESRESLLEKGNNAREKLAALLHSLENGSRWKKWENWTLPENFRIHTPPPALSDIDEVIRGL